MYYSEKMKNFWSVRAEGNRFEEEGRVISFILSRAQFDLLDQKRNCFTCNNCIPKSSSKCNSFLTGTVSRNFCHNIIFTNF